MKNNTMDSVTKGGRIEKAIKRRFPFASQGAVSLLMVDLKGLINPVLFQLHEEVKEWERQVDSAQDEASAAWSEVDDLKVGIKHTEFEVLRVKMLKQFYSY